jgi:hypothetical protein
LEYAKVKIVVVADEGLEQIVDFPTSKDNTLFFADIHFTGRDGYITYL